MTLLPPRTLVLDDLAGGRGGRVLFAQLSLRLRPGEAAVLRGRNGAGKTTLLMIVAGLVRPFAGTPRIEGGDAEGRWEAEIAYLPHRAAVKARLTVGENLKFWADLNGVPRAGVLPALAQVGLAELAGLDAGYLSAGQARRLALARVLAADRPVWLLDEPTAALDAGGEALVARLIDDHLERGGIVLAATHHDLGLFRPATTLEIGEAVAA